MAETTHTGIDVLEAMDLDDLVVLCDDVRRYLEVKADAQRRANER